MAIATQIPMSEWVDSDDILTAIEVLEQKGQESQARLQFDQQKLAKKDALDRERLQSMEDVAQLRANVSLERARQ